MEEPRVQIRTPTIGDAEAMGRVHVRAWQAAYRGVMPDDYLDGLRAEDRARMWRRQISRAGTDGLLVAELEGAVVGFVAFGLERERVDGDPEGRGEVYAINLDPDRWGQGIGRRLFRAAVADLEAQGFVDLVLWVVPDNARARRLYELEGWSADGTSKEDNILGAIVTDIRYTRSAPER